MEQMVCDTASVDCMMHLCPICPGKEALTTYLHGTCPVLDELDEIQCLQWVAVDKSSLLTICETSPEFLEALVDSIYNLTPHHFTAKAQATFLKELKVVLQPGELIILMDFAENYSFLVQDAIQAFYWTNRQATLHPFVVYYREPVGCGDEESPPNTSSLLCQSFCIISDCLDHSTAAVHLFQRKLLMELKTLHPEITKVHYFSDGAASQYKNRCV
jgi:hypothetical protein